MTIPDEAKQAARAPTDAELAAILRGISEWTILKTEPIFDHEREALRLAAQRFEASPSTGSTSAHHAQGEISEAMVERARIKLRWLGYQVSRINARDVVEAALSRKEE